MSDKEAQAAELMAKAAAELAKADKNKKLTWERCKDLALRFVGGLFMERKGEVWAISVGRVSWWLAFSPALYIWIDSVGKQDITPHHLTVLLLLAGYNFGKKVVEKFKQPPTIPPVDGPG